MARIRTIKPEAFLDEELWDLGAETGLPIFQAFVGLWTQADREGRFAWKARRLKAAILPYWDGDFSRVLDALATRGFIVRYASDGREYGHIRTFNKHQVINNRESPSEIPPPPENGASTRDARVDDASSTREVHAQAEGKGREGKGKEEESPQPAAVVPPQCPHQEIIELYHECLPELPRIRSWTDKRKRYLQARWREEPKRQSLDWWRKFFTFIRENQRFLLGNNDRGWVADLEWIVTEGNFAKILEGARYRARETA